MTQAISRQSHSHWMKAWSKAAGPGWSPLEVVYCFGIAILAGGGVSLYALWAELPWSTLQHLAAAWVAFDLAGGAITYNSLYTKRYRSHEDKFVEYLLHNLIHIHPLILAFFASEWLGSILGYHVFLVIFYLMFYEPKPRWGLGGTNILAGFIFMVHAGIMAAAVALEGNAGIWGAAVYLLVLIFTAVVFYSPVKAQQVLASGLTVLMFVLNGSVIEVPQGFLWMVPVFFMKLILGFTAREEIPEPSPAE